MERWWTSLCSRTDNFQTRFVMFSWCCWRWCRSEAGCCHVLLGGWQWWRWEWVAKSEETVTVWVDGQDVSQSHCQWTALCGLLCSMVQSLQTPRTSLEWTCRRLCHWCYSHHCQSLLCLKFKLLMWKPNFFTTGYGFAETGFLSIIEMSLLFENTDERCTGQACAKSRVGITWWTTLCIFRNYVERPIADTKTCWQVSYRHYHRLCYFLQIYLSQNEQS